jgi:hypothetical protein
MSAQPQAATSGAAYTCPLPFVRRASDRRIEVFSPKLGRRLSLTSYAAWQLWLALEANPEASTFCERPAFIEGTPRRTIDFWVRFNRHGGDEFWLLDDAEESADDAVPTKAPEERTSDAIPEEFRGTALRLIPRHSLRAWSTPVANWAQLVPYLVTWRRFADPLLAQSIVVFLGQFRTLDEVLERFADHDRAMAEAALYSLVANGRVLSPDLATSPLSGTTRFRRV